MENRIAWAVAAVMLVLLGFNAITIHSLGSRVAELEIASSASPHGQVASMDHEQPRPRRAKRERRRQQRTGVARPNGVSGGHRAAAPVDSDPPPARDESGIDLDNPEVREQVEEMVEAAQQRRRQERRQEREAAWSDSMNDEVSTFATEFDVPEDTVQQVRFLLTERHEVMREAHSDARNGSVSWMDARKEMDAEGETSDAKLADLLGEDDWNTLKERMFGDRGRH